jgi:hypothetical protein
LSQVTAWQECCTQGAVCPQVGCFASVGGIQLQNFAPDICSARQQAWCVCAPLTCLALRVLCIMCLACALPCLACALH